MDITDYRKKIDEIDSKIVSLVSERMDVAAGIAAYKKENGLPVLDMKREREKLCSIRDMSSEPMKDFMAILYSLMFDMSRSYQSKLISEGTELTKRIEKSIEETPKLFPEEAYVACQGTEGAYAQLACDKLFRAPHIMYCNSFESVFAAVDSGLCSYGIVPLENSTAGSVNSVYDLMMKYSFSIVRSTRLKIDHNLLAKPGTRLSDVKEIYSHQQAISQCAAFLRTLEGVKIIPCENTAIAAKMVSESDRTDIAALSSRVCMKYYGLDCIRSSVQDQGNNYTRFICISKKPQIFPGADRTSLMATLPHEPGSLYKLLSRLYAYDINLNKLESRPIPDRDFEFMFYFDIDVPVYSPRFLQMMGELDNVCETFTYLGSYSEMI